MPEESFDDVIERALLDLRAKHQGDLAERDKEIAALKAEVGKRKFAFFASESITDPYVLIDEKNTVVMTNPPFLELCGYGRKELADEPITVVMSGLEFLDQILEHPFIMSIESIDSLGAIPVHIRRKGESTKPLERKVDVYFNPGEMSGYHGAKIIVRESSVVAQAMHKTGAFLAAHVLRRRHDYEVIHASKFSDKGGYLKVEQERKEGGGKKLYGQALLEEIVAAYGGTRKKEKRGVIVDFSGVIGCDEVIYKDLQMLSTLGKQDEAPADSVLEKFSVYVIVDQDSVIYQGLKDVNFPESNIRINKRKK